MMETTRSEPGVYAGFQREISWETASCPPAFLEYTWYVVLAYAMLGLAWGVVIPSVGGALLAILAAACFLSVGAQVTRVYAPVALALCTGILVIAVQFFFHSALAFSNSITFIGWLLSVVIVQALSVRKGFVHRFALVAFVIGLGVLPYVGGLADGRLVRASAAGTGISNPNSLGMWFGFSTLYFIFWGVQSRDPVLRFASWTVALGCFYVVTLTVSRGPVLGILLACLVGFKSELKRHFVPIISLVALTWLVYVSGIFQATIDQYSSRGLVETGRGTVAPLALQRIFNSPWTGVGLDAIPTMVSWERAITPHNGLLYLALGSGIIPLLSFLGYLTRVGAGVLHILRRDQVGEVLLIPPLVTFALFEVMTLDAAFMSSWVVVVFAFAVVKRVPLRET